MGPRHAAFALLALAAAQPATAACSRELHIGVSDLGYSAFLRDGRVQGVVPDLLDEVARLSGCRLTLRYMPRARVLLDFERGEIDVVTSAMRAADRDRVGHFLPYAYTKLDLVVASAQGPQSLKALLGRPELRLGLVRGVRLGEALEEQVAPLLASRQAEYSPDFNNLAAKLVAGRIQAAIMPNMIHAKLVREGSLPPQAVIVDLPEAATEPIGLYLNRGNVSDDDVQLLQAQIAMLRREGWIQQLYARYVGEAEARRLFRSEAAR
ncbi:polar amino acid transport system substrate-binding protein [Pelomonas saccharophila]|uniref:Polar amino acid transport system substrate-binding protein n=1 Tax=Roseateles saccharophilus TaxID=304 RepID=A0ABU1YIE3_ROSSA|nr:transporter substrate-binding domain-containing protein [Roseateles saccharophilus]MDR7268614.1 polar amino acid transport system substrate-binding protein [Roseateles saccharophilus]